MGGVACDIINGLVYKNIFAILLILDLLQMGSTGSVYIAVTSG